MSKTLDVYLQRIRCLRLQLCENVQLLHVEYKCMIYYRIVVETYFYYLFCYIENTFTRYGAGMQWKHISATDRIHSRDMQQECSGNIFLLHIVYILGICSRNVVETYFCYISFTFARYVAGMQWILISTTYRIHSRDMQWECSGFIFLLHIVYIHGICSENVVETHFCYTSYTFAGYVVGMQWKRISATLRISIYVAGMYQAIHI